MRHRTRGGPAAPPPMRMPPNEDVVMKRTLALGLALALTAVGLASAQETTTGSIAGRVVDAHALATPGATVTVTGPQGSRTLVTDDQGRFLAPFLTPGTYEVRIELQGFKPTNRRNVVVRLGQRVELTDLKLEVGDLSQVVEVVAATPVVDTATTTVGASFDNEFLASIPIGRRFSDTFTIAPGVSSGGGTGSANPSIGGNSGLNNQYLVDGINITNTGFGALGSYSIVFGSLGNGLPFDFMEEVQVKTGGYEPEYGQSTGGVVNVITKSGSNVLRGTAFGYWRPTDLQKDFPQVETVNGTVNTTEFEQYDVGAEVGGPVWKDKVFFFGAIDPQEETRTLIAPNDVASFPLRALGEVDRDRTIVNYAAKGTVQLNSSHRFDVSVFGDPGNGDPGPQRANALLGQDLSRFSEINEFGGHNVTARWDGIIRPNWLVEASFARAQNDIVETPSTNLHSVTDRTVSPSRVSGGIGFFEQNQDNKNFQYQAKTTYLLNGWGSHSVRGGFIYEDISFDRTLQRTGPTFTLPNGQQTVTGAQITVLPDPVFDRIFRVTRANTSNVADSNQDYVSLFAQDTWRFAKRVTVVGGLRWDRQKLEGTLEDFTWDENFAPRIGGTVDVSPDGSGRAKAFGSWGRFYSKVPNDIAVRALSADAGVTRADYFDENLTQPVPEGVLAAGVTRHFQEAGLEASVFDPDQNGGSIDEFILGLEWEVAPKLSVGGQYINRRINDVVEDIGTAPIAAFFTGQADSVEFFVTNPGPETPVIPGFGASHEDPIQDYDAVEIFADKRFDGRWALQASYRWGKIEGTFEGFFRNDNGQSDPGITSLNDFPTNDPSFTQFAPVFGFRGDIRFLGALGDGPLPNDRRHQFKVFGSYLVPRTGGLNVGVSGIFNSGAPLTALAANPVFDNGGEIPEGPRGSGIQTVNGFKHRTDFEYNVDLHADYAFRLPGGKRIQAIVDVFNLFDIDQVTAFDNFTELSFSVPNPDFGKIRGFQDPLQVRIGARFHF